jgi:hypothetical protein
VNVLILTPDAVGSTLLQRLLTIYMQFHDFDRPVINLHELTNGLEKYFSPDFNREIVSKSQVKHWGYYQSLQQVVDILSSVDHYKTSRLAQYHIRNRVDPIEHQIPFYRYLDENFFVIACRRHNVFEHALSMSVNTVTKKLNVYNHQEKISAFLDLHRQGIKIDEQVFMKQLDAYKDYLDWSESHFNIGSYFHYDQDLQRMEQYILDLPIWPDHQAQVTWQEKFGLELNDWNRCNHIPSDLGSVQDASQLARILTQSQDQITEDTVKLYQQNALPGWPEISCIKDFHALPAQYKSTFQRVACQDITQIMPSAAQQFLAQHATSHQRAESAIQRMRELDIIVSPPPIKKHTLAEKIAMIMNVDRCLDLYNIWILKNPSIGPALTQQDLQNQAAAETDFWQPFMRSDVVLCDQPTIGQLGYQSDDDL